MKTCKIINGTSSWRLEVDGKVIPFTGSENAGYLAEIFRAAGYEINFLIETE